MNPVITVVGESLIDLLPGHEAATFQAIPGGSPFNVAVGTARLGVPTALMARFASGPFGRILRDRATQEGLDISGCPPASQPSTVAVIGLGEDGQPSYDFYVDGTADWAWTEQELRQLPSETRVVHFGSLASWTSPGDAEIGAAVNRARLSGDVLVSYDPNIRRTLTDRLGVDRAKIEASIAIAHLVKASSEDVHELYPGQAHDEVARRWIGQGADVVVITDGASGSRLVTATGQSWTCPARPVTVIDTVGAGDSFTSAMLTGLVNRNLHAPGALVQAGVSALAEVLGEASAAAALTCSRHGADPPTSSELRVACGYPPTPLHRGEASYLA